MRKNILTLIPALILFMGTINSCNNVGNDEFLSSEKLQTTNVEKIGVSSRESSEELETFLNDEDLQIIINKIPQYKSGLASGNMEIVNESLESIVASSERLNNTYGEATIEGFFNDLIINEPPAQENGTHDGDKCTRNKNGTTYWDKCSTWGEIKATFSAALNCPTSNGGPFNDTQYYICVQAAICRNC